MTIAFQQACPSKSVAQQGDICEYAYLHKVEKISEMILEYKIVTDMGLFGARNQT